MGTKAHKPNRDKPVGEFVTGHAHDDETKALGPGVRPGTRSLLMEARARIERRGAREVRAHQAVNAARRATYAKGTKSRAKAAKAERVKHSTRRSKK